VTELEGARLRREVLPLCHLGRLVE
jgi:hypothetical protein